jgi:hypothetical protein
MIIPRRSLFASAMFAALVVGVAWVATAKPWASAEEPDPMAVDEAHLEELQEYVREEQEKLATPVPGYKPPASCPSEWEPTVVAVTEQYIAHTLAPGTYFVSAARVRGSDGRLYEVWSGADHKSHRSVIVVRGVVADPCANPEEFPPISTYELELHGEFTVRQVTPEGSIVAVSGDGGTHVFEPAKGELDGRRLTPK